MGTKGIRNLLGLFGLVTLFLLPLLSFQPLSKVEGAEVSFPAKPVKLVSPYAIGGGTDLEARGMVPYLEKYLKATVTIENIAGAGGKIAFTKVWKTNPDGYTILYHVIPASISNQYMLKGEYQVKDFTPIFAISRSNMALTVASDSWKTWDEFIKAARSRVLSGATSTPGGTAHLQGLAAVEKLGIKVNWIPYEGGSGAMAALAGKHLDFAITFANSALTLVDAGKVRPILIFADEKDFTFPEAPTSKDLGLDIPSVPGIRGIIGPPKIPPERVKIFEEAMAKVVTDPEYVEWAKKRRMEIVPFPAREYYKQILQQYEVVERFKDLLDKAK